MPEVNLSMTADQVAVQVSQMMRRQRKMCKIETLNPAIQKLSDDTPIYVFNVSPWVFKRESGSWGEFVIPACPEGKPYSVFGPIPGIFTETVIQDEANMRLEQYGARQVAEHIVGLGRHLRADGDYTKWGLFIGSRHVPEPTGEELRIANNALVAKCKALVKEATTAYNKGAK